MFRISLQSKFYRPVASDFLVPVVVYSFHQSFPSTTPMPGYNVPYCFMVSIASFKLSIIFDFVNYSRAGIQRDYEYCAMLKYCSTYFTYSLLYAYCIALIMIFFLFPSTEVNERSRETNEQLREFHYDGLSPRYYWFH